MKREKIKKIYFVEDVDKILDDEFENLLMCSTKNWNYYFTKLSKASKKKAPFYEEIINVNLLKFDSNKKMFSYLDQKDPRYIIDWSLEHNAPLVLEFAKI